MQSFINTTLAAFPPDLAKACAQWLATDQAQDLESTIRSHGLALSDRAWQSIKTIQAISDAMSEGTIV